MIWTSDKTHHSHSLILTSFQSPPHTHFPPHFSLTHTKVSITIPTHTSPHIQSPLHSSACILTYSLNPSPPSPHSLHTVYPFTSPTITHSLTYYLNTHYSRHLYSCTTFTLHATLSSYFKDYSYPSHSLSFHDLRYYVSDNVKTGLMPPPPTPPPHIDSH